MKRSLQQGSPCGMTATAEDKRCWDDSISHKKVKRSPSSSGMAAMTLLSLSASATQGDESEAVHVPALKLSIRKTQQPLSPPTVIPCRAEEVAENGGKRGAALSPESNEPACVSKGSAARNGFHLPAGFDCCALQEDWRKVFKPLPLPPRLPSLPAGAKAGF